MTQHDLDDETAIVDGRTLARLREAARARSRGTPHDVTIRVDDIRSRIAAYRDALPDVEIAYAAKAFLIRAMARLVDDEGLSLDVCSSGEVGIATAAGFPADIAVGDLVAVACSRAYHVSLSLTYNQVGRPPVIAVENGRTTPMPRCATLDDLLRRDVLPADGRAVLDTAA